MSQQNKITYTPSGSVYVNGRMVITGIREDTSFRELLPYFIKELSRELNIPCEKVN